MIEPERHWYVMLFPAEEERRTILAALRPLAEQTGGELNEDVHVTVGYFHGGVEAEAVVDRLRPLDGPQIVVHASGLFSFSDEPDPLAGWSLSLRVHREGPVQGWQRMVRDALATLPLAPVFSWGEEEPHMVLLRHLPLPPSEVLTGLADRRCAIEFTAARVVVSERVGDSFVNRFAQGLGG